MIGGHILNTVHGSDRCVCERASQSTRGCRGDGGHGGAFGAGDTRKRSGGKGDPGLCSQETQDARDNSSFLRIEKPERHNEIVRQHLG